MRTDSILFLDVASQTGVVEGPVGGVPQLQTVRFSRDYDDDFDAAGRAVLWMAERFALSVPKAVYVEAPPEVGSMQGHTNAQSLTRLIGLVWSIAGVCKARGVPIRTANVKTVRTWFIGQGNMEGQRAKREAARVARELGFEPKNLDEADAFAGWYWACGLHEGGPEAPRTHWAQRQLV